MAYGTVLAGQAYWDARGYVGVLTLAKLEVASAYIDGLGWRYTANGVPVSRFPGVPTDPAQASQWPRTGAVEVYGNALSDVLVPTSIEQAAYEAAWYEQQNPSGLNPVVRVDQFVTREKFDVIEFEYAPPQAAINASTLQSLPVIPTVLALLAPYLCGSTNPYGITGVVV